MRGKTDHTREAAALALARRHHGAVARQQLLALGFTPKAIERRLETARLEAVFRGAYAWGGVELSQEGWWMAAILAVDEEKAAISHESGVAFYEIGRTKLLRPVHLSLPAVGRRQERGGIVVHRRRAPFEVVERNGIRVTTPECTIIDMAARQSREDTEEMISQAVIKRLTTEESLRAAAGAAGRRPGAATLRRIMDIRAFRFTRSGAERAFIPIALRAGLGMPLVNHVVHGYEVDFFFPEIGLVVEIDGFTYHQTAAQRAKDLERDQILSSEHDLIVVRFSAGQVRYEADHVERVLAAERRKHAVAVHA